MTMLNRSNSAMPADHVFSKAERQLLEHLVPDRAVDRAASRSLSLYITKLARLGGYLARADDPPPGNKFMWRGFCRLADVELGFNTAKLLVIERMSGRLPCNTPTRRSKNSCSSRPPRNHAT